jgi:hypothetical protein
MPRRSISARVWGCGCPNSLFLPRLATASRGLTRSSHRASIPSLLPWCASFSTVLFRIRSGEFTSQKALS